jgi:hypothetical protein
LVSIALLNKKINCKERNEAYQPEPAEGMRRTTYIPWSRIERDYN